MPGVREFSKGVCRFNLACIGGKQQLSKLPAKVKKRTVYPHFLFFITIFAQYLSSDMKARAQAAPEKDQQTPSSMTLEAYFDFEYRSTTKHEFWNGQVRAMSYTSPNHGRIQTNIMDELAACMKANGCTRYTSDRMVFIPECNKVFYPDVMIICGAEQFEQYKKNMKATLNPSVIIEILSDTIEQEDKMDMLPNHTTFATIPHGAPKHHQYPQLPPKR
jgi:hypothetical protein